MFSGWTRRRAARQAAQKMARARAAAEGAHVYEWHITGADLVAPTEAIVSWCRDTLASCRRPFGIDHFDLTLAVRRQGETQVSSRRFLRLRPSDLYTGSLSDRIEDLVSARTGSAAMVVAAALFSWGEAAHQALPKSL